MKSLLLLTAGFLFVALNSCNESKSLVTYQTEILSSFDELNDTILFSDVQAMVYFSEKLYFTDYKNSQLYVVDDNGKLIHEYFQKGNGPEDMNGAFYLYVDKTGTYIYDDGNRRFFHISDVGKIQTIPKAGQALSMRNFVVSDSMLFYADYSEEGIIACDNMKGEVIERFGEPVKFDSPVKTRVRNGRFIHTDGERLFIVSNCMPLVECYDLLSKQLINKIDLTEISDFENLMAKYPVNEGDDNSSVRIIESTYYENGKLYILYNDPHAEKYTVNKLLVLDTEREFTPVAIYVLPAQIYTSFCVPKDGKRIFAMNYQNSRIEQIKIEE